MMSPAKGWAHDWDASLLPPGMWILSTIPQRPKIVAGHSFWPCTPKETVC